MAMFSSRPPGRGARNEVHIARNIRTIEWLKSELFAAISALHKGMLRNSEDAITDALANIIITCFILGKRLGISFSRLAIKLENKVRANIDADHEIERWYGDFSELLKYLEDNKRCR